MGERPTLADAVLVGVARWLDFHRVAEPARWPRLAAWRKRIEAEEAVQFALRIEGGERAEGSGALRGHAALGEVIREFGS